MAQFEEDSEKIQVHLIEGYRTVIVDSSVKFLQVIDSITERLSSQYAENKQRKLPLENKFGWIFGMKYVERSNSRVTWLHPELTHGEFVEKICPKNKKDKGELQLRVRYFPQTLHEIDREYRIIFTLLYKQVFHDYMNLDEIPSDLAVQLAVLEMRRKYPDLSGKGAALIWNDQDNEISFRNFFPLSVIKKQKIKDLRREVKREFARIESDGLTASDAAIQFLSMIKDNLFKFDRETYHVKLGQGWSVKLPVVIGPDDQISHLELGNPAESIRMTDFRQVTEIIASPDECRLTLNVLSKSDPLILTCSTSNELDNLADLIDGYCRGARNPKIGTIIKQYNRELPSVPFLNGLEHNGPPVDDDYAEIGEQDALQVKFDPVFEIDRNSIQILGSPIGRGQFGNVYKASFNKNDIQQLVAVKSSHCQDESTEIADRFVEEARIMSKFDHPHIIQLIGVCTDRSPIFIVMELCEKGSLREYLQKNENYFDQQNLHLIRYVKQLASALSYLESQSFVHRDIAARNLLMYDINTIKLGDFGLSRLLEDAESYYVASNGKLPIKWMAPESINFRKFTTASDVWMFGVCAWEILSCGTKPFSRIKNNDVIGKIENGERLNKPDLCPHPLFSLLEHCWKYDPAERPTATEVDTRIELLIEQMESMEQRLYDNYENFKNTSEIEQDHHEISPSTSPLTRNPTIPPKSGLRTPKEILEDEAQHNIEEEKRKSRILTDLEREQIEELDNQKWLEKSITGPNMNLKQRLNSRSSRSTASQSDSSSIKSGGNHINGNSLERNNSRKSLERSSSIKAPAKPPRSTRNSSSSSSIRKEKSISDDSNSSSRNNSLDKRIIAVQENDENLEPEVDIIEEIPPKIVLSNVEVPKSNSNIDRENDSVYNNVLSVCKEIQNLQIKCRNNGLPDDLLANVASIGRACKELNGAVDQYADSVSEEIHRQLELEKRSVTSELRQVATQMQNVKKFNGTRANTEYRKGLLSATIVLAITVKNLLDTVDKSRVENT